MEWRKTICDEIESMRLGPIEQPKFNCPICRNPILCKDPIFDDLKFHEVEFPNTPKSQDTNSDYIDEASQDTNSDYDDDDDEASDYEDEEVNHQENINYRIVELRTLQVLLTLIFGFPVFIATGGLIDPVSSTTIAGHAIASIAASAGILEVTMDIPRQ